MGCKIFMCDPSSYSNLVASFSEAFKMEEIFYPRGNMRSVLWMLGLLLASSFFFMSELKASVSPRLEQVVCQIAIDGNGNQVAVWQDIEDAYYFIRISMCPAGMSWSDAQIISDGTMDCINPQVAMNDEGKIIVIWQQMERSTYGIQGAQMVFGSDGVTPIVIADASNNCYFHKVGIDAEGNMVAAWVSFIEAQVQASLCPQGGDWGSPIVVTSLNQAPTALSLSMNAQGEFIMAWQQRMATQSAIMCALGTNAGISTEITQLSNPAEISFSPSTSMNSWGDALVTWHNGAGAYACVEARKLTSGMWDSEPTVISVLDGSAISSQTVLNDSGNGVAVWQKTKEGNQSIEGVFFFAESGWDLENISTLSTLPGTVTQPNSPQVAMNNGGLAIAVWQETSETGHTAVDALYAPIPMTWTSSQVRSDMHGALFPKIQLNNSNLALAGWVTEDSDPQIGISTYSEPSGWSVVIEVPD